MSGTDEQLAPIIEIRIWKNLRHLSWMGAEKKHVSPKTFQDEQTEVWKYRVALLLKKGDFSWSLNNIYTSQKRIVVSHWGFPYTEYRTQIFFSLPDKTYFSTL